MISKDSIESAYCFLHQKYRVYETQRDDIEIAITSYVEEMNKELYAQLAKGREEFLCNHTTFAADMQEAINELESRL